MAKLKRTFLVFFFCMNHFMLPFVYVNCGSVTDIPYDQDLVADEELNCLDQEFVVEGCEDEIIEAQQAEMEDSQDDSEE